MVVKRIVLATGALTVLAGLSQVLFAPWWIQNYPPLIATNWLAVFGVILIMIGCVTLIAALEKLVALRGLFVVLGAIELGFGILAILSPAFIRDLADAFFLKRSLGTQILGFWFGGLLRVILGALMIYAVVKAPVAEGTAIQPEPPPTE